ncbi:MAG: hypothetical protein A2Y71_01825 [Bacteroidetes bacterium RBG_13_42_15]|nr:MAG: hypothetical protein A2Y71_01825 [Bacteroidetes bacterium RBG_13_42_15]
MLNSNPAPTVEFLHGIHETFYANPDGSFYINHNCFLVENHIVKINQIYALLDYEENSISNVIPFRLEDLLIVSDFIIVVGVNMIDGEELGRNEYLIHNDGCAFKIMDFNNLKNIMNKMDGKIIPLKAE